MRIVIVFAALCSGAAGAAFADDAAHAGTHLAMPLLADEPAALHTTAAQPPTDKTTTEKPSAPAKHGELDARLARVLGHVPANAHIVVVVPDVEALLTGISAFGTAVGSTTLADTQAEQLLGKALGAAVPALDLHGPLVVALPRGYADPLLITTIGCRGTWAGCARAKELPDGLTIYELGSQSFVGRAEGDIVIFARDSTDLRAATGNNSRFVQRFTEAASADIGRREAIIYVDVAAAQADWSDRLGIVFQSVYLGMATSGADTEIAALMWNWMLEQVRTLLAETRTCIVALHIDREGIFAEARADFTPDGPIARYLRQVRPSKRDLFRGLPAGKAAFAFASEWEDSPGTVSLNEAMTRSLFDSDVVRRQMGAESAQKLLDRCTQLNRMVPGASAAFSLRPKSGMTYWGLYLTQRPDEALREMRAITELSPEFLTAWGTFPAAMRPQPPLEVAGVIVDAYAFDVSATDLQAQPMMAGIYGEKPTLLIAPHPEGLAYAFGPAADVQGQLDDLLAPGKPMLADDARVQALRSRLTAGAQSIMVVDVTMLVREGATMMASLGLPIPPMDFGDREEPLAGFGFYLDRDAVRLEVFVPSQPIRTITDATRKAMGAPAAPPY